MLPVIVPSMNNRIKQGQQHFSERSIAKAESKLGKLSRIVPNRAYESNASVSIERESGSHTSEKMWRASVNLDLAGDRINATMSSRTPEKALNTAIREVKQELTRTLSKRLYSKRRGAGVVKRLQQSFA